MGYEMPVDLRVLEFLKFDVLLGMNWIAAYHTLIDSFAKKVTFYILGYPTLVYRGKASDKPITRGKLALSEEIEALANMALEEEEKSSETKLEDISIIKEYPNVFPTDLLGLPSKREIDFVIELVPRTKLIFIPSYRMIPKELKN